MGKMKTHRGAAKRFKVDRHRQDPPPQGVPRPPAREEVDAPHAPARPPGRGHRRRQASASSACSGGRRHMARVKRSVNGRKHRRAILEEAQGLHRCAQPSLPQGQRAGHALAAVRVPRPAGPQGRVPPALDRSHQCGLPRARHRVLALHRGSEGRARSTSTARSSPTSRCASRRPSARSSRPHARPSTPPSRMPRSRARAEVAPAAGAAPRPCARASDAGRVRGRRSARRRGRARPRVPRSRRCTPRAEIAGRAGAADAREACRRRSSSRRRARPTASATRARRSPCSRSCASRASACDAFASVDARRRRHADLGSGQRRHAHAQRARPRAQPSLGLGAGSVDAYNPKVVRASAGACFAIRTVEGVPAVEMLEALGARGVRRIGAVAAGRTARPKRSTSARRTALVLGHEAHGLDADLPLDELVTIPMQPASRSTSRWPAPCCCSKPRGNAGADVVSAGRARRTRAEAIASDGPRRDRRARRRSTSSPRSSAASSARRRRSTTIREAIKTVDGPDRAAVGKALSAARVASSKRRSPTRRDRARRPAAASRVARCAIASTSRSAAASTGAVICIRSRASGASSRTCSSVSATRSPKVPRSSSTGTTSKRSTSRPGIPARAMQDTLYVRLGEPEQVLLRTHTSPVQVRTMEAQTPADLRRRARPRVPARHARRAPLARVPPDRGPRRRRGHHARRPARHDRSVHPRAVRPEHQRAVPAVVLPVHRAVGRVRDDVRVLRRRRAARCARETGWVELGGAGMVDPNVFAAVDIDPERYTGFAFGFGIDRLVQLLYGVDHVKNLWDGDVRFLAAVLRLRMRARSPGSASSRRSRPRRPTSPTR